MKKLFLLSMLLMGATLSYGQTKDYNQVSLGFNYGASIPISPKTTDRSEAIGFTHIEPSLRVMFNPKIGIKGFYAYDSFGEKNKGLSAHRLGAEVVLNLDDIVNIPYYIKKRFGFQAHAGLGLGLLTPRLEKEQKTSNDFMAFMIIGGGPQVKLSDKIALIADLSFNQLFLQNTGYNGMGLEQTSGNYAVFSIGFQFYLGKETYHADWY